MFSEKSWISFTLNEIVVKKEDLDFSFQFLRVAPGAALMNKWQVISCISPLQLLLVASTMVLACSTLRLIMETLVCKCSLYSNYMAQSSFLFGEGTAFPHLFFSALDPCTLMKRNGWAQFGTKQVGSRGGQVGQSPPQKNSTKVTFFNTILNNSENSIRDVRPFCRPLLCPSSVVTYASSLLH